MTMPPRCLGQVGGAPGPTLLCIAALHGNEPAGLAAARRVLDGLRRSGLSAGSLIVLAGNLSALAVQRRYLHRDLNRGWRSGTVARLRRSGPESAVAEDREQSELLDQLELAFRTARGPLYVLDLHTTSGDTPPFVTIGDTLRNRSLARRLPLPLVLGLEEQVAGTLLEYVGNLGHTAVAVEGGRHDDPASVDHLEAAVWLVMDELRILPPALAGRRATAHAVLAAAGARAPRVVEMRHRHRIRPGERYLMRPGYSGFARVARGEAVADSAAGPVCAPLGGRVLMPCYQPQGDDGYFVVRDVRPVWLSISAALRRARADRLVRLLPGVRSRSPDAATVLLDLRVARWWGVEIFHLLGYRRRRRIGRAVAMTKRHFDLP